MRETYKFQLIIYERDEWKFYNIKKIGGSIISALDTKQYWENRLQDNWGLQGVGYLGLGKFYNDWMYRVRKKIFFRNVRTLVDRWDDKDVLDLGSGTGFYIKLWKALGVNSITATDFSTLAINNLKKTFSDVECLELDISESLPEIFKKKQYEAISAFDVLFHIVNDEKYQVAIKNIFDMLSSGGLFIFSENFIRGKTIRKEHQVSRSQNDIESILKKVGFKILLHTPMFVIMNHPMDSQIELLKYSWEKIMTPVQKFPYLGIFLGGLLFPIELVLTSDPKRGPSTELMICLKPK